MTACVCCRSCFRIRAVASALAVCLLGGAGTGLLSAARAEQEPGGPAPLRVAVTPLAGAVEWSGPQPTGVMVDIWENLAGRLDVRTEFVREDTFPQLMSSLPAGRADVALGPLAITEERERIVDLTHPLFHSGLRIAVRQRSTTGFLSAFESLLSPQLANLLGLVLGLALLSGHLLWWFERRHNPHSFPPEYPRGAWEATWWIASTIVTGGCDDKHVDSVLGRALAFAWMIGGIVLLAAFTSVLTATITAERVTGTIHGPRDLAGRTIGCQAEAVTVPAVRQRGGVPQEFAKLTEALDALQMGMVDAVVSENQQLMFLVAQAARSDVRLVGPIFDSFDYGIALTAGSPLREQLNTAILRMREDGTLDRIKATWLGSHD
jgi:polar amino acid transport system substrate-binding protein